MFLFPLRPGVERTGEQILEGGKTTQATQAMHRAWSELRASFSWPPFPIFFPPCQLCMCRWICLALSVLPCPFLLLPTRQRCTHRGSTAQLPAQLQICAPSHPGRRANAAPSSVDFAHRKQATTHSCSARRCVPRPARLPSLRSCQANNSPVAVGVQFVG